MGAKHSEGRMDELQGPALLMCVLSCPHNARGFRGNQSECTYLIEHVTGYTTAVAHRRYDSAIFTPENYAGLFSFGQGSKQLDPTSTGKFGLGFNSIYHVTDVPMFMSGKYFVALDPQRRFVPGLTAATDPGMRTVMVEENWDDIADQFTPFKMDCFGCNPAALTADDPDYDGTLFRFPIRTPAHAAETTIKPGRAAYSPEDILRLFRDFGKLAAEGLLFMSHLEQLEFWVWQPDESEPTSLHVIKLTGDTANRAVPNLWLRQKLDQQQDDWKSDPDACRTLLSTLNPQDIPEQTLRIQINEQLAGGEKWAFKIMVSLERRQTSENFGVQINWDTRVIVEVSEDTAAFGLRVGDFVHSINGIEGPITALCKARAISEVSGGSVGLNFKIGDEIVVTRKIDAEWRSGEFNGETGKFPASYVNEIPNASDAHLYCGFPASSTVQNWVLRGGIGHELAWDMACKQRIGLTPLWPYTTVAARTAIVSDKGLCGEPPFVGIAYATMPIPAVKTGFPVHVNARWSLADNRNMLADENAQSTRQETQWNRALMKDSVARVWAKLLVDIADQTFANQDQEPLTPDRLDAFYKLWPRTALVKSPWSVTVKPAIRLLAKEKVFARLVPPAPGQGKSESSAENNPMQCDIGRRRYIGALPTAGKFFDNIMYPQPDTKNSRIMWLLHVLACSAIPNTRYTSFSSSTFGRFKRIAQMIVLWIREYGVVKDMLRIDCCPWLIDAPHFIYDQLKAAKIKSIRCCSPQDVRKFYRVIGQRLCNSAPVTLEDAPIHSIRVHGVSGVRSILWYALNGPKKEDQKSLLASLKGFPGIVTETGHLSVFGPRLSSSTLVGDLEAVNCCTSGQDETGISSGAVDSHQVSFDEISSQLQSLNDLVMQHITLGEYEVALNLCKQALGDCEKASSRESLDVATVLELLAAVYHAQQKYYEAGQLLKECVEIRVRIIGSRHPAVVRTLNKLVKTHVKRGKHADALSVGRQSLELFPASCNWNHSSAALLFKNLALIFLHQNEEQNAEVCFGRALHIYHKLDDTDNVAKILEKLKSLSALHQQLGHNELACRLLNLTVKQASQTCSIPTEELSTSEINKPIYSTGTSAKTDSTDARAVANWIRGTSRLRTLLRVVSAFQLTDKRLKDRTSRMVSHAVALYNYTATNSEEISLNEGDVIAVYSVHEFYWLEGMVGDNRGLFPRNCVNFVEPKETHNHEWTANAGVWLVAPPKVRALALQLKSVMPQDMVHFALHPLMQRLWPLDGEGYGGPFSVVKAALLPPQPRRKPSASELDSPNVVEHTLGLAAVTLPFLVKSSNFALPQNWEGAICRKWDSNQIPKEWLQQLLAFISMPSIYQVSEALNEYPFLPALAVDTSHAMSQGYPVIIEFYTSPGAAAPHAILTHAVTIACRPDLPLQTLAKEAVNQMSEGLDYTLSGEALVIGGSTLLATTLGIDSGVPEYPPPQNKLLRELYQTPPKQFLILELYVYYI